MCHLTTFWIRRLTFFIVIFTLHGGYAQDTESIYLRYQGILQGIDLAMTPVMSCQFSLKNIDDDIVYSEQIREIELYQNHFSVTLGTDPQRPLPTVDLQQKLEFSRHKFAGTFLGNLAFDYCSYCY